MMAAITYPTMSQTLINVSNASSSESRKQIKDLIDFEKQLAQISSRDDIIRGAYITVRNKCANPLKWILIYCIFSTV